MKRANDTMSYPRTVSRTSKRRWLLLPLVAALALAATSMSALAALEVSNGGPVVSDSPTNATLSGQIVVDGGDSPSIVRIYFGDSNGGTTFPTTWATNYNITAFTVGADFTTNVTGLLYGKTYYYTVYASNSTEDAWSAVTNFTTAASTPWTPAAIPTEAWFDAADPNTIHTNNAVGRVSQWDDKSGKNRHATQSTLASQPSTGGGRVVNGLNVINFDGDASNQIKNLHKVV